MLNKGNNLNDRELRKQKRKIIRGFIKDKEFSRFEKEALRTIEAFLNAAYHFYHSDFYDYLKTNEKMLIAILMDLDTESKNVVSSILNEAQFYETHDIIDLYKDLFNREEEIIDHLEKIKSYRHHKLHATLYERSVFDYHHGLVYLPQESLNSLNNKDFIDGGGYIGDSALVFEKYYNPKKIYSFEPDEENYNYILQTIEENNLKKVVPIKLGIGEEDFFSYLIHQSSVSHLALNGGDYEIELTSIDKFVRENNLSVGLIKMDIEGYELNALKGARKTIEDFKPILLISIYHNGKQFIDAVKYVQDLALDYNIIIRHLGGPLRILETYMIAW